MLLADILFLAIVVYLAYRFIFNFLLPIVRATHHVRQQFRNMGQSNDFNGGARNPEDSGQGASAARSGASAARPDSGGRKGSYKPPAEDYIDFEEIKK